MFHIMLKSPLYLGVLVRSNPRVHPSIPLSKIPAQASAWLGLAFRVSSQEEEHHTV